MRFCVSMLPRARFGLTREPFPRVHVSYEGTCDFFRVLERRQSSAELVQ